MTQPVKMILLGAGVRGMDAYAPYAAAHPDELSFVAVAEPNEERRNLFASLYGISPENCFDSWEQALAKKIEADAVLISMMDRLHYLPTLAALEKGYHVMLEKPMSADPLECIKMGDLAALQNRKLSICHVLRYTAFFRILKSLLVEERIGKLVSIAHNENVGYWHQAHSFVRGNWSNSSTSGPMILTKSCHDMDLLIWLAGADCRSLSSFGSLAHFTESNAPAGAPEFCLDGCPNEKECLYHAGKLYLNGSKGWPASSVCVDTSEAALRNALHSSPYGRCVYRCDNDVVDHQVVNLLFENEVTAAFTMCAFTDKISRTLKLMGTHGQIRGAMEENLLEITDFRTGVKEEIHTEAADGGHGGGDFGMMRDFIQLVRNAGDDKGDTPAELSVQSHLMSFAAEKSRIEHTLVDMKEYRRTLEEMKPSLS